MDEAAPFGSYAPTGFVRWLVERTRALPDSWLARRLVILARRIALSRLRHPVVDVEALGLRMRLEPSANICDKRMLFAPGTFDPVELAILADRLPADAVFIDVGANIGAYALFVASRTGPAARILAVEPQPTIFDRLIYNVKLNGFSTIKAVACAVADRPGDLTLFLDARNSGESSVRLVRSNGAHAIRVPGRTLLEIVDEEGYERLDAVKLDVEGAEDLVLEPFLSEAPPALHPGLLIIEDGAGQWQTDLLSLLARHGYRELAKTRLNRVFELIRTPPTDVGPAIS